MRRFFRDAAKAIARDHPVLADKLRRASPHLTPRVRQDRRHSIDRVVGHAGRDADNVTARMLLHFSDCKLRDTEETGEVHGRNRCVVISGVAGKRLGDEDAGVVDQRVDAAEACHAFGDHAAGGGRVGDIARHRENVRIIRRPDGS
jgi:hypothetical protein